MYVVDTSLGNQMDGEVAGSIPSLVITKTLKMVLAAHSLGTQH